MQPKKCALCGALDEQDSATCQFCGEATWNVVEPAPQPELVVASASDSEPDAPKRGRPKKS